MEELTSKTIHLASHKKGQSFNVSFNAFIAKASKLSQQKVSYEELDDFADELTEAIGECASWTYFTRKFRDEALGKAFEDRPKSGRNSEEQISTARAAASKEIRAHELCKELKSALQERLWLTRQKLEMKANER